MRGTQEKPSAGNSSNVPRHLKTETNTSKEKSSGRNNNHSPSSCFRRRSASVSSRRGDSEDAGSTFAGGFSLGGFAGEVFLGEDVAVAVGCCSEEADATALAPCWIVGEAVAVGPTFFTEREGGTKSESSKWSEEAKRQEE